MNFGGGNLFLFGSNMVPSTSVHFANYVGDPINEIIRLFEFDSVEQWEQWEKFLADSEEGKDLVKRLSRYIVSLERKLLVSIYPPTQKTTGCARG